jgi:cysteine dioxygenase
MQNLVIGDWVKKLAAIEKPEFTVANVLRFAQTYGVVPDTLKPYLNWSMGSYTRNLIFKSTLFEVLAICWETGQFSQVHNHRDQNCWMAVPIGKLRVQNFRVDSRDALHGQCGMVATDRYDMDAAHPAAVEPDAPVHQVLNLAEFGERAVSLHIYSYPYDSCEVYVPEKGTYYDVPLHYTSEYGKPSSEEKLA